MKLSAAYSVAHLFSAPVMDWHRFFHLLLLLPVPEQTASSGLQVGNLG